MRGNALFFGLALVLVFRQVLFASLPAAVAPPKLGFMAGNPAPGLSPASAATSQATSSSAASSNLRAGSPPPSSTISNSPERYLDLLWSGASWLPRTGQDQDTELKQQQQLPRQTAPSTAGSTTGPRQRTLHVLYGLSGNLRGFMDEFVVSLKSVLLNAPMEASMHVHLIVDTEAHQELTAAVFPNLGLNGSVWRNPIVVTLYPVSEALKASQMDRIRQSLPVRNVSVAPRVGPGGLFRLFAGEILPLQQGDGDNANDDVESVLYMDNEIVVFANLAEVLNIQDPQYMFQIGTSNDLCSGLMILNAKKFGAFLNLLSQVDPARLESPDKTLDDQLMLLRVKELLRQREHEWKRNKAAAGRSNATSTLPSAAAAAAAPPPLVGDLPREWHVHLAHGHRRETHKLRSQMPGGFGMLHFNGIRANQDTWWGGDAGPGVHAYCAETKGCETDKDARRAFRETWNLAEYYVNLPFEHAKYLGRSVVRDDGGTALVVRTRCPAVDPNCTYT